MPTWMPRSRNGRGDVERARELVRLHADQHHHAGTGGLDHRRQACRTDAGIGLVEGVDLDLDVIAEHATVRAVAGDAVEAGERVRRDRRAEPLDDVAVIVVMRRLDQHEAKAPRNVAIRYRRHSQTEHPLEPCRARPTLDRPSLSHLDVQGVRKSACNVVVEAPCRTPVPGRTPCPAREIPASPRQACRAAPRDRSTSGGRCGRRPARPARP